MSLQVWLPLNGDLHNQGLENIIPSTNGATLVNGGKISNFCYNFDGTKYLAIPKVIIPSQTANWSFVCWLQLADTTTTTATCLFSERTGANSQGYTIFIYPKTSQMLIDDGARWTITPMTFTAGIWYHLAITRSPQGKKLYIDGQLKSSTTTVGSTSAVNTNGCLIGYAQSNTSLTTGSQGFKGKLNDIRIYNHSLSAKEVEEISKGLVLHYQLNNLFPETINPNLLPDTNVNSLSAVVGPYARYFESASNGTYTKQFETISDPPVSGIQYGVHYNVTSASGFHGLCWYNGGLVPVEGDQTYTISCYGKKLSSGSVTLKFQYGKSPYKSGTVTMTNDTNWHQYKWSFTPETGSGKAAAGGTTRIYGAGPSTTGELIICGWKLEKGSAATPWCEYNPDKLDFILQDSSGYQNNSKMSSLLTGNSNSARYAYSSLFGSYTNPKTTLLNPDILQSLNHCTITWWEKCTGTANAIRFNGQSSYYFIGAGSSSTRLYDRNIGANAVLYKNGVSETSRSTSTDDNGLVVYHEGIFHTQNTWDFFVLTDVDLTEWTAFKMNSYSSSYPINAYLNDIKIYATILTESQIQDLYKNSMLVSGTSIVPRNLE